MRFLPVLLALFTLSVSAEEECVFDETAYGDFISAYSEAHANSSIGPDGRVLIVNRGDEHIVVQGGGCVHLGVVIELTSRNDYTDKAFLHKVVALSVEFGDWLINTEALKDSITNGRYQIIDGVYFIDVDGMTVFSASRRGQGGIHVDFYIN